MAPDGVTPTASSPDSVCTAAREGTNRGEARTHIGDRNLRTLWILDTRYAAHCSPDTSSGEILVASCRTQRQTTTAHRSRTAPLRARSREQHRTPQPAAAHHAADLARRAIVADTARQPRRRHSRPDPSCPFVANSSSASYPRAATSEQRPTQPSCPFVSFVANPNPPDD